MAHLSAFGPLSSKEVLVAAATNIQRVYRGHVVRIHFHELQAARLVETKIAKIQTNVHRKAPTIVERKLQIRAEILAKQEQKRAEQAALKIQCLYRGHAVRRGRAR